VPRSEKGARASPSRSKEGRGTSKEFAAQTAPARNDPQTEEDAESILAAPDLTRAERIQRIGELLYKGICRMLAREAEERRDAAIRVDVPSAVPAGLKPEEIISADDMARAIVDYLKRVPSVSPRDIQRALQGSKATVYRRLKQLLQAGCIIRSGKTTAVRYRPRPPTTSEGC
jgi:DNA-binding transcriptional ArsR family regulator